MITILPTILHVEDDPNDRFFLKEAFRQTELPVRVEAVANGQEAINYLSGAKPYNDRAEHPEPALVLLDLKMPLKNGFEVLTWMRSEPACQYLPVAIFTASKNDIDMRHAYEMGANSYLIKPVSVEELLVTAKGIYHYWFILNQTPSVNEGADVRG